MNGVKSDKLVRQPLDLPSHLQRVIATNYY